MNAFVSAGSTDTLAYNILHTHMSPLTVIYDKLGFMFYTVMGLLWGSSARTDIVFLQNLVKYSVILQPPLLCSQMAETTLKLFEENL